MKLFLFRAAVFVLGAVTGAALAGITIGDQVDRLHIENQLLQDRLAVAEKELQQMRQQKQVQKRVVSKISTRVSFAEECDFSEYERSFIELTVEKIVREWLKVIAGQEIDSINYILVPRIVDNREIEIEGKKIKLKVELVVIAENLVVYLEIIPQKNKL